MTESEKEALGRRLDRVRQLLTPPGTRTIDNETLLNAMCDIAERERLDAFHRLRSMCLMMHASSIVSLARLSYLEIIHR